MKSGTRQCARPSHIQAVDVHDESIYIYIFKRSQDKTKDTGDACRSKQSPNDCAFHPENLRKRYRVVGEHNIDFKIL